MTRPGLPALLLLAGCAGPTSDAEDPAGAAHPNPVEVTLEASPATILPGAHAGLAWTARNALDISLFAGDAEIERGTSSVTSGSLAVAPRQTTTYRIVGHGAQGRTAEAASTVTVDAGGGAGPPVGQAGEGEGEVEGEREGPDGAECAGGEGADCCPAEGGCEGEGEGDAGREAPVIVAFAASPDDPGADDEVVLAWETTGASAVRIVAEPLRGAPRPVPTGDEFVDAGAVTDLPGDTTTYRLTATGAFGEVEAGATVVTPLSVTELSLPGGAAVLGGEAVVRYRVQGADAAELAFAGRAAEAITFGPDGRGQARIADVRQGGDVTVFAIRDPGRQGRSVALALTPPEVVAFEANVAEAPPMGPFRLSWDVRGAAAMAIRAEPAAGGPAADLDLAGVSLVRGGVNVRPFLTTRYVLTATNPAGEGAATVTVELPARVVELSVRPHPAPYGGDATLRFRVHGATEAAVARGADGLVPVPFNADGRGTYVLEDIMAVETVTLRASGPGGEASAAVEIGPAPPLVRAFGAMPPEVDMGEEALISWEIDGAAAVAIRAAPAAGPPFDVTLGGAPADAGSVRVALRTTTRFVLTATNPAGESRAEAVVAVPLRIRSLEVVGSPAVLGDDVEVRARVQGAVGAEVEVGGGPPTPLLLDADGWGVHRVLGLRRTQAVVVRAYDADGGSVTRNAEAELRRPQVRGFAADPVQGGVDVAVGLAWDVVGAELLALLATPEGDAARPVGLPPGPPLPRGVAVRPTRTTRYDLDATNASGSVSAHLDVVVPLEFLEFEVVGVPVEVGGTATLHFRVQGAARVQVRVGPLEAAEVPFDALDGRGAVEFADVRAAFDLTLTATDGGGRQVVRRATVDLAPIVRDPTGLRISEVFYDAAAGDDGREWVELKNAGAEPVHLADVFLGRGGGHFGAEVEALPDLVVEPGGCVVIGGPLTDPAAFASAYDVVLDFEPDIQNAGAAEADGIGLFDAAGGRPGRDSRPFDAVVYGPVIAVGDRFIGPDGEPMAAPHAPDAPAGRSVARDAEGRWAVQDPPDPGVCYGGGME